MEILIVFFFFILFQSRIFLVGGSYLPSNSGREKRRAFGKESRPRYNRTRSSIGSFSHPIHADGRTNGYGAVVHVRSFSFDNERKRRNNFFPCHADWIVRNDVR